MRLFSPSVFDYVFDSLQRELASGERDGPCLFLVLHQENNNDLVVGGFLELWGKEALPSKKLCLIPGGFAGQLSIPLVNRASLMLGR